MIYLVIYLRDQTVAEVERKTEGRCNKMRAAARGGGAGGRTDACGGIPPMAATVLKRIVPTFVWWPLLMNVMGAERETEVRFSKLRGAARGRHGARAVRTDACGARGVCGARADGCHRPETDRDKTSYKLDVSDLSCDLSPV